MYNCYRCRGRSVPDSAPGGGAVEPEPGGAEPELAAAAAGAAPRGDALRPYTHAHGSMSVDGGSTYLRGKGGEGNGRWGRGRWGRGRWG